MQNLNPKSGIIQSGYSSALCNVCGARFDFQLGTQELMALAQLKPDLSKRYEEICDIECPGCHTNIILHIDRNQ